MGSADFYAFLKQHRYGVVSSSADDGTPQSALVGVATTPELDLVFDTVKSSRKYANLTRRPRCSFVIGWSGEQTVQFEGIAEEPRDSDLKGFQDVYFEIWPECRTHLNWPDIAYFVVHPKWLRYSDYEQAPPLICEFTPDKSD